MAKIILFLLLFYNIFAYDHWTYVKDETFNWETNYDNVKWLLFFKKKNCNKCNEVFNLLNSIMLKYIDKNVGFVLIDAMDCPWLVNRFNVTYLPKIILLENNLMYKYHSDFNDKNIINFIDKKKQLNQACRYLLEQKLNIYIKHMVHYYLIKLILLCNIF